MTTVVPENHVLMACARTAHEANNLYCIAVGDALSPAWDDLTDAQREGIIDGARHAIAGGAPRESHERWMASRIAEGWIPGAVKDFARKISPNLVPYDQLPPAQRAKDDLFIGTVRAMARALGAKVYTKRLIEVPEGTQRPSVGRVVHYQAFGTPGGEYKSRPRAAVISETIAEDPEIEDPFVVGICVLNPTGQFFTRHVPFSPTPKPGHWSWPPRV